jgi:2-hydroxy-3-keto-5-methylthiopentenyl-1-phosphate phosphatase
MINKNFKIFIDFDGTITQKDVGDAIFLEFGNKEKTETIIDDLLAGRISARDTWLRLCDTINNADEDKICRLVDTIEIDSTFHGFIDFCRNNNLDFFVLSDGFDFYINRILKRENLEGIEVFCNKLEIKDNKLIPAFPHYDESCFTSANCKQNHVISKSSDDDFTVYIGDGNSDRLPAQFCDFIFAKHGLLKYCEKERITYFPYNNFNDVIKKLEELSNKKRLKKRHQAELKRKERYMVE